MSHHLNDYMRRIAMRHPRVIDLSLQRMHDLLAALGNPHHRLPPTIHVAGTNGKGSTIAFMRAMLEAAGYSVHVYSSPHIVRANERIVVNGHPVSDDTFIQALRQCEQTHCVATLFEVITAAALTIFASTRGDVLLLETGLGGRYDATNVVTKPLVSAITAIDMDHMSYLGNTLRHIAREKAGICKDDVPLATSHQHSHVKRVLHSVAKRVGVPFIHDQWHMTRHDDGSFHYDGIDVSHDFPAPSLHGHHQYDNAATAIATLECAPSLNVSASHMARGIARASWRGRLERLSAESAGALGFEGEVWLDGGHNPAAAVALANALAAMSAKKLHILCGILRSKDIEGFLAPLIPLADQFHMVTIDGEPNAATGKDLCDWLRTRAIHATAHDSVTNALAIVAQTIPSSARLLIGGSLYLVGRIHTLLEQAPYESLSCSSTQENNCPLGSAPTRVAFNSPLAKNIKVGMLRTP